MDYKKVIREEFDNYVNKTFPGQDIKNFLIRHERKELLVNNLTIEIRNAEHMFNRLGDTQDEKRKMIKGLMKDLTRMFCKAALDAKAKEMKGRDDAIKKAVIKEGKKVITK